MELGEIWMASIVGRSTRRTYLIRHKAPCATSKHLEMILEKYNELGGLLLIKGTVPQLKVSNWNECLFS